MQCFDALFVFSDSVQLWTYWFLTIVLVNNLQNISFFLAYAKLHILTQVQLNKNLYCIYGLFKDIIFQTFSTHIYDPRYYLSFRSTTKEVLLSQNIIFYSPAVGGPHILRLRIESPFSPSSSVQSQLSARCSNPQRLHFLIFNCKRIGYFNIGGKVFCVHKTCYILFPEVWIQTHICIYFLIPFLVICNFI